MLATRPLVLLALLALLSAALGAPRAGPARGRARRQLADDDALQPLESGTPWRRRARAARSSPSWSPTATRTTSRRRARQASATASATATTDDIPVFDRNKVSLDVPGSLFGPSVSLLIRTTKIIGDVIQNSAVRYQTFLRLFRPLFRGQFEIKGLDPPTTTTTTPRPTTTTAGARGARTADNEVRRR